MFGAFVVTVFASGIPGMFMVISLLLQAGFDFSPLESGLTNTPFSVGVLIASFIAGRFGSHYLRSRLAGAGALLTFGIAWLHFIIAGVTETTEHFFACTNAGDVPRLTALLTDAGIYRFYGFGPREESTDAQLRAWADGETTPREDGDYARLIAVTDVSMLPDGRAAAFVVINEPLLPPRGPETLLFVYALSDDGTWLIEDYYDFTIVAPEDEGTE